MWSGTYAHDIQLGYIVVGMDWLAKLLHVVLSFEPCSAHLEGAYALWLPPAGTMWNMPTRTPEPRSKMIAASAAVPSTPPTSYMFPFAKLALCQSMGCDQEGGPKTQRREGQQPGVRRQAGAR